MVDLYATTYLSIQQSAFAHLGQILRNNTLLGIERQLAIRTPRAIKAFQELLDTSLVFDTLFYLSRRKMELVRELRQRTLD